MPTQVRLFISAGPDLEPAREMLGRALAELPVNVGWVLKRTPDVDSAPECHLFMVLLGLDIVAPVGLELWWARRSEKPILAYYLKERRSPACQVFWQQNRDLNWTAAPDMAALRRAVMRDLARFLLHHAERYGLMITEAETLHAYVRHLEQIQLAAAPADARGAGGGGVILAPGKDETPGARLIEDEG
jgi:hypothetical protein